MNINNETKEINEIIEQGPGLVFMVLPEAIRNMNYAPVWAILFFLMIFMLGIDSQVKFFFKKFNNFIIVLL